MVSPITYIIGETGGVMYELEDMKRNALLEYVHVRNIIARNCRKQAATASQGRGLGFR